MSNSLFGFNNSSIVNSKETNSNTDYKLIQSDISQWNTSNSLITVIINSDLSDISGSSSYNFSATLQSDNLSSNVSSLQGIRLEVKLNYYFGEINYKPLSFTAINKSGITENSNTQIDIPSSFKSNIYPNNSTKGVFLYKLHFYEYLKGNKIVNFTTTWYPFTLTTINNVSIIPVNATTPLSNFPTQTIFIVLFLIAFGIVFVFLLRKQLTNKTNSKNQMYNGYNISNAQNYSLNQEAITKKAIQNEQILNPKIEILEENVNQSHQKIKIQKKVKSPVIQSIPKFMCPNCKSMIKKTSQFCPECGKTIERCNICQLPIENNKETILCPYCKKIFHFNHFLESVKLQGSCPICKESLSEDKLIRDS